MKQGKTIAPLALYGCFLLAYVLLNANAMLLAEDLADMGRPGFAVIEAPASVMLQRLLLLFLLLALFELFMLALCRFRAELRVLFYTHAALTGLATMYLFYALYSSCFSDHALAHTNALLQLALNLAFFLLSLLILRLRRKRLRDL